MPLVMIPLLKLTRKLVVFCFITALLSSCATTVLPLCPAIAEISYPDASEGNVNYYIAQATEKKGIEFTVLSPFSAEFRGSKADIKWLTERYSHMLCAFDSEKEVDASSTYITCMEFSPVWIEKTQNDPGGLFLDETEYDFNCVKR